MKRVLVLKKTVDGKKFITFTNELKSFLSAARDVDLTVASYQNIAVDIVDGMVRFTLANKTSIDKYDFVYFYNSGGYRDSVCLALAYYLDQRGIPFFDQALRQNTSNDKLYQYVVMAMNGIPVPKTIYQKDLSEPDASMFPLVYKATNSSSGDDNYLIKDIVELQQLFVNKSDTKKFVLQEFIRNDRDYRLFIVGGELAQIIERRRTSANTHLNNSSKGATTRLVDSSELPDIVIKKAIQSANIFGIDVSGVDVIITTEGYFFLEVNSSPDLVTESNPAATNAKVKAVAKSINSSLV